MPKSSDFHCPASQAFWTCNGVTVNNLIQLATIIEAMNEQQFTYHVNENMQKNDFAKWIKEVFDDEILANRLRNVRLQREYVGKIRRRLTELVK